MQQFNCQRCDKFVDESQAIHELICWQTIQEKLFLELLENNKKKGFQQGFSNTIWQQAKKKLQHLSFELEKQNLLDQALQQKKQEVDLSHVKRQFEQDEPKRQEEQKHTEYFQKESQKIKVNIIQKEDPYMKKESQTIKEDFQQIERVRVQELKYICRRCYKTYSHKSYLLRHIEVSHPEVKNY